MDKGVDVISTPEGEVQTHARAKKSWEPSTSSSHLDEVVDDDDVLALGVAVLDRDAADFAVSNLLRRRHSNEREKMRGGAGEGAALGEMLVRLFPADEFFRERMRTKRARL